MGGKYQVAFRLKPVTALTKIVCWPCRRAPHSGNKAVIFSASPGFNASIFFIFRFGWWLYSCQLSTQLPQGFLVSSKIWENRDCWVHWLHLLSCWGKHLPTVSPLRVVSNLCLYIAFSPWLSFLYFWYYSFLFISQNLVLLTKKFLNYGNVVNVCNFYLVGEYKEIVFGGMKIL